jgi:uncharacterized lipoprotein YddW (UPF0748 family)
VATVDNIDWPSRKDLSTADQKSELLGIIDRAAKLKLNAIVLQVRPQCDAIYPSQLEPWSEFLTGQMGRAPQPAWDPLAFAIAETHKRGIELHAWFNPYRAVHPANKGPVAAGHVSKTRPHLVRNYGKYLWLDPGEREVQDYSLAVVLDVVKRYDVDGVHFDDYFYPYQDKVGDKDVEFPDDASWQRFGASGKLSRNDWRRENVNQFVERVHKSIKDAKPWVKFGISPFGIWRPGYPPQIKGYDAYEKLYADARKWLREGSVDYFVPQLYWPIAQQDQSFPVLLNWWHEQNPKRRHVWPGLATYKLNDGWKTTEIVNQIRLAEKQLPSAGHVHYSMKMVARNANLQSELAAGPYAEAALVPACGWLGVPKLSKPSLATGTRSDGGVNFSWSLPAGESANLWLVQTRNGSVWKSEISALESKGFENAPDVVAVSAINRAGIQSAATILRRK